MSQTMNVSMAAYTQAATLYCSQYDVGRVITVNLLDESGNYTIPSGATVVIEATKPSGYGFSESCTWSGSTVTITLTSTMTEEGGRFPAELKVTSGTTVLCSANFLMKVEDSPHLENVVDGDAETAEALTLRVSALETQVATNASAIGTLSDLDTTEQGSLVGAVNELKSDLDNVDGISEDVKQALLQIASKVAYVDSGGQDYYDALYDAFYPDVSSITCVYTQSGTVYSTTSLDSLKSDLVVTAVYSDSSTETLEDSDYSLSGTLSTGTSTVTVTYGNYTTTFSVTVTGVVSIDAVYTQSGTVSDTDGLSVLIPDLVVTATLSDSSTFTVSSSDYTLSGTLEDGTSTITVTYGTLTTTFVVTVTEVIDYTSDPLDGITWYDGYSYNNNTGVFTAASGEHCTDKFTAVYNCIYTFTNSSSSNTYPAIFAWDGDGNYLGYSQASMGLYSLKKGYSYAVKAYNASTFDSSTITLLPTDNSSTAVSEFSINLADYIGSISGGSSYFEISISSSISAAGLSTSNWATSINKCNYLAYIAYSGSTTQRFKGADFTFWFFNINTLLFRVSGISDVTTLETYLESNPITITFNEGVS